MFRDATGYNPYANRKLTPLEEGFSILGTIMGQNAKNRQDDKFYDSIINAGKNIDNLDFGGQTHMQDQASRDNPDSNYMNKTAETQIAQGLLPTSFQTTVPTSDMIGQGLLSGMGQKPQMQAQPQTFFNIPQYQAGTDNQGLLSPGNIDIANRPTLKNADGSISTVRSMGISADGKEILLPTIGPKGEDWTQQQALDAYKQTGKNLGTFDSPDASEQYAKSLHEQQDGMYNNGGDKRTPLMGKYDKANNPVDITVSPQKTFQEQVKMMKDNFGPAFKELREKNPGVPAKDIYTMLQQVTNDKIAEHKEAYNQQMTDNALTILGSNADYKTKFIAGAKAGMKPEMLKMALDNGMSFHNLNLTDRQLPVAYDKHNNKVINLQTGMPVTNEELQNGVSPTAVYNKNTVSEDTKYRINNRPAPRVPSPKPSAREKYMNSPKAQEDKAANDLVWAHENGGDALFPTDYVKAKKAAARYQWGLGGDE